MKKKKYNTTKIRGKRFLRGEKKLTSSRCSFMVKPGNSVKLSNFRTRQIARHYSSRSDDFFRPHIVRSPSVTLGNTHRTIQKSIHSLRFALNLRGKCMCIKYTALHCISLLIIFIRYLPLRKMYFPFCELTSV